MAMVARTRRARVRHEGLLDIQPGPPSARPTWILPVFALAYLIFDAAGSYDALAS
jgi:hypothetical protein